MLLYFAGPLFNNTEKEFNKLLAKKIEALGVDVFLPQRDGVEKNKSPYNKMVREERRHKMFELDRDKIIESNIFLFVLDGRVPDEGACVELGIAYADKKLNNKNRLLVGLQTDIRAAFLDSKLNPMISVPLDYIAPNEKCLIESLKEFIFNYQNYCCSFEFYTLSFELKFMQPSEEIKSRLDIVDVIRDYIQLQQAGSNFRAKCPFHSEKTPSFMVSPEKQIWHCFGCGKGGDVLEFVKEIEGINFAETLRLLAPKSGVELKKQNFQEISKRNRLLDILEMCSKYYNRFLTESKTAENARKYLTERGVDNKVIVEWGIGYSPEGWDNVYSPLRKKGFHDNEIFEAGMSLKRSGSSGYYDRFRGRIMFPINDVNGNIVAFTARVSPEKEAREKMGKYINSPQTDVYNKSKILFGLDKAKLEIKNQGYAIIVEGQMDAITAHKYGFKNVVASSGTALTDEQIVLLKRFTNQIIIAFDMDNAGIQAAEKGITEAMKLGMMVKILSLPDGKDPDECIRKNLDGWRTAIKEAKYFMDYYFDKTFEGLNLDRIEDRDSIKTNLLPHVLKLPNEIEKDFWVKKISEKMGAEERSIRGELTKIFASQNKPTTFKVNTETKLRENKSDAQVLSREEKLSELVLSATLRNLSVFEYVINHIQVNELVGLSNIAIYKKLIFYYNNNINNHGLDKSSQDDLFDYFSFREWLLNEDKENGINQSNSLDRLVLLGEKEISSKEKENKQREINELLEEFKILSDELSSI